MKYSAIIDAIWQVDWCRDKGILELQIPVKDLSREGGLKQSDLEPILTHSSDFADRRVVIADRLVEEKEFEAYGNRLATYQTEILRIKDLGVAKKLAEAGNRIQLNIDTGNANWPAIEGMLHAFPDRLQRVILNHEIPKSELLPMLRRIPVETEILGLGPILMYYSRRPLLSWTQKPKSQVIAKSEDMGNAPLRIVESPAGTGMYFSKELSLLQYADELDNAGLDYLRLDLRQKSPEDLQHLTSYFESGDFQQLREKWPNPLLHGFYGNNRSDSVFKHLPKHRRREDRQLLAEVIDQSEKFHLIKTASEIHNGQEFCVFDAKGNTLTHRFNGLTLLDGKGVEHLPPHSLARLPKTRVLKHKALIYSRLD